MGKREPQIILKTDERKIALELDLEGKFAAKSRGWDENRVFLEGDRLEVAVKNGRWVLTHLPAGPRRPKPVRHYFTGRRVTPSQRRERRCVAPSPVAVETGNGVADEEAERLGGASRIGRRRLRVARAGNLRDRALDARAYAQSHSPRFSLRGAKMVPGTVRQT